VHGVATREHDGCHDMTGEASIAVDRVQGWLYRGNMNKATKNTKQNLKAASKKAADAKHNKATDAALAGIEKSLATKKDSVNVLGIGNVELVETPAPAAPKAAKKAKAPKATNGVAKPNVRFNNFEKRSTYEAVAQLARTGPPSTKSALDKLILMGWDKHELDTK
jgi:hypothetical protein